MDPYVHNAIGLMGVSCILAAYFFLQSGKLHSDDGRYLFLNIIGSIAILISLIWEWNFPSFMIQVCWIIISLYGVKKLFKKNKEKQ